MMDGSTLWFHLGDGLLWNQKSPNIGIEPTKLEP